MMTLVGVHLQHYRLLKHKQEIYLLIFQRKLATLQMFRYTCKVTDASTQAKLNRGERTVEVLKQGLHEPLVVEKQVMILYALVHGFLDDIPVEDVVRFESEFHTWLDTNAKEILDKIRETGQPQDKE